MGSRTRSSSESVLRDGVSLRLRFSWGGKSQWVGEGPAHREGSPAPVLTPPLLLWAPGSSLRSSSRPDATRCLPEALTGKLRPREIPATASPKGKNQTLVPQVWRSAAPHACAEPCTRGGGPSGRPAQQVMNHRRERITCRSLSSLIWRVKLLSGTFRWGWGWGWGQHAKGRLDNVIGPRGAAGTAGHTWGPLITLICSGRAPRRPGKFRCSEGAAGQSPSRGPIFCLSHWSHRSPASAVAGRAWRAEAAAHFPTFCVLAPLHLSALQPLIQQNQGCKLLRST